MSDDVKPKKARKSSAKKPAPAAETAKPKTTSEKPKKEGVDSKNRTKMMVLIAIIILLLLGLAGAIYLYFQQKSDNDDLSNQIEEMTRTLVVVEKEDSQDSSSSSSTAAEEPKGAEYSADVGDYTLKLPEGYVIIREIDGSAEGGPISFIYAGKPAKEGTNVYDDFSERYRVRAQPNVTFGTIDDYVATDPDLTLAKEQATIKVDGETARVFKTDDLFVKYNILFVRGDNTYEIVAEVDSINDSGLQSVISGFSFN